MIEYHNIKEKIKVSDFIKKLKIYGIENIETSKHTFFRLSEKQRKIYTEEVLKNILFNETPLEVSIEKNRNYAVIYNFNEGKNKLKVLLSLAPKKVYIVTFYILNKDQERLFKHG